MLIEKIKTEGDSVSFDEVIEYIGRYYDYSPVRFVNGIGDDSVVNSAGSNEGSCKIFAFSSLNDFTVAETLMCFGDYYRKDVLQHPEANDHANIRTFMRHGWSGIHFDSPALKRK